MATREYELVLMLDPETPDERRDQIAQEARQRIEGKGSLKAEKAWGMRKMAYEIQQRTEADYRFFRFETEAPLLDELDHSLKMTDGVLRFRLFKVD
ncbi:MAG TPA: 30S ribosomal protein S6, partial [Solirubrobacterales bacterium]|nr:30S ribosomal protein S6 [Solirubrobacterales bacterium]